MSGSLPRTVRFGAFTVDTVRGVLFRDGVNTGLRRRCVDVLSHLISRSPTIVSTDELVSALWPVPPANPDASVAGCISEIRDELQDERSSITTVPLQGYAFAGELILPEPATAAAPEPLMAPAAAPEPTLRGRLSWSVLRHPMALAAFALAIVLALASVAVGLVSKNSTPPLATEPLTMLAVPTITVISAEAGRDQQLLIGEITNAIMGASLYRLTLKAGADHKAAGVDAAAFGRRLGVRYVAVVAPRSIDKQTAINLQLFVADTGRQMYAEPFAYDAQQPNALSKVSTRIGRTIATRVLVAESQRPLPETTEPGHYVILGAAQLRGERTLERTLQALAYFNQALEKNPKYLPALHGYAGTKTSHVQNRWPPREDWPRYLDEADDAINRIIAIDRQNVAAYYRRAAVRRARGDVDGAIAAFNKVLEMRPAHRNAKAELARVKIEIGGSEDALRDLEALIADDPSSPGLANWQFWAGQAVLHLGRYDQAALLFRQARTGDFEFANILGWLAIAEAGRGNPEAAAMMAEFRSKAPYFTVAAWNEDHPRRNPVVAAQRAGIEAILRRLGVPESGPEQQ